MESIDLMNDTLNNQINEIMQKRNEIKEAYVKAWLACNVPDANLNADWLINNVVIVEHRRNTDNPFGYTYSWHMELKK